LGISCKSNIVKVNKSSGFNAKDIDQRYSGSSSQSKTIPETPLDHLGFLAFFGLSLALFNSLWTLSVSLNGAAVSTVLGWTELQRILSFAYLTATDFVSRVRAPLVVV